MDWNRIDENIFYIDATRQPLSANVVVMEGKNNIWLYDVGTNLDIPEQLNQYAAEHKKEIRVVLSHFHPDHTGNLSKIHSAQILQGKNTYRYTGTGEIVEQDQYLEDGSLRLHIFPIPSSHAKGSLALEVNEMYCFLGDSIYATMKNQKTVYNAGILKEQIKVLEVVKAPYFANSHKTPFIQSKQAVLRMLESVYANRKGNEPYIEVE